MSALIQILHVLASLGDGAVSDAKHAEEEGDETSAGLHNETAQAYATVADIVTGFLARELESDEDSDTAKDTELSDLARTALKNELSSISPDPYKFSTLANTLLQLTTNGL